MKKMVLLSLIAALAAAPAFAEISLGAWGRGMFSPLMLFGDENDGAGNTVNDTGFVGAGAGVTWMESFATEIDISGGNDFVGFGIGIDVAGGWADFGLNAFGAHIWVQPLGSDLLRLTAGRYRDDTLRGRQGHLNNGFEYFVLPDTIDLAYGEADAIFHRFNQRGAFFPDAPVQGFMLSSRPIEELFLGFSVTAPLRGMDDRGWGWSPYYAGWVFRTSQIGLGFDIAGIGSVRAQFLGGFMNIDATAEESDSAWAHLMYIAGGEDGLDDLSVAALSPRIEFAFAYTGMEGLLIDFGFKFHLPSTVDFGDGLEMVYREGIFLALGASFEQEAFRVRARLELDAGRGDDFTVGGQTSEWRDGLGLGLRLVPAFNLGFGWAGLDLGVQFRGESSEDGTGLEDNILRLGFGGFFEMDLGGSGIFKTGLTYTLPTSIGGEAVGSGVLSIPVLMEFWF